MTAQLSLFQAGQNLPLFSQAQPEVFASGFCVDDLDEGPAYPLDQCDVCGIGTDGGSLCRQCAEESLEDLDAAYQGGRWTFTEYQAEVDQVLARAGLRGYWPWNTQDRR